MNTVFTIGHSTRSLDEFLLLLKQHDVTHLVDIRTIPASRHNPQYASRALENSLNNGGIKYTYMKALGGLRPAVGHTVNGAWRNKSFRNYADYMQTRDFGHGLEALIRVAEQEVVAIMCAEAVPWRCHRSLVADALVVRGIEVGEIIGEKSMRYHTLTSFASVRGNEITYPPTDEERKSENGG